VKSEKDTFIKKTGIQSQLDRPGVDPAPILHQITMPVSDGGGFVIVHFSVTLSLNIHTCHFMASGAVVWHEIQRSERR